MRFNTITNSFRAGEVSPSIRGRQDIAALKDACEEITNFDVLKTGGIEKRPGIVNELLASPSEGTIHGFFNRTSKHFILNIIPNILYNIFSTTSRSLYGDTWTCSRIMKVFDEGGTEYPVIPLGPSYSHTVNSILYTAAEDNWYTITKTYLPVDEVGKGLSLGDYEAFALEDKIVIVDRSGNTCPIVVSYSDRNVYQKECFFVYPWYLDAQLYTLDLTFTKKSVVCPISPLTFPYNRSIGVYNGIPPAFGDYKQQTITREGKVIENTLLTLDEFYLSVDSFGEITPTELVGAFARGRVSAIARDVPGAGSPFNIWDIDLIQQAAKYTSYDTACFLLDYLGIVNIDTDMTSGVASYKKYYRFKSMYVTTPTATSTGLPSRLYFKLMYSEIAISKWSRNNFPKVFTSYKGRLFFAATTRDPASFWINYISQVLSNSRGIGFQVMEQLVLNQDASSDVSEYGYFLSSSVDDKAIQRKINQSDYAEIKWIKGKRYIHVGTSNGGFIIEPINGEITAASLELQKVTTYPSSNETPVEGDQKIIYVTESRNAIRAISTNARDYEAIDTDITLLTNKYGRISNMVWIDGKSTLYFTANGELLGITLSDQAEVVALRRYDLGGYVKDITLIRKQSRNYNIPRNEHLAVLMEDGRFGYLEIVVEQPDEAQPDYRATLNRVQYMDWASSVYSPTSPNIANTMYHGKTLHAFINGNYASIDVDAIGDIINLPDTPTELEIGIYDIVYGIPFKAKIVTIPIEAGAQFGTSIGDLKRIDRANILTYGSGSFKYGSTNSNLYTSENFKDNLYTTGNIHVDLPNSSDRTAQVVIESELPYPLNISGISYRGVSNAGV